MYFGASLWNYTDREITFSRKPNSVQCFTNILCLFWIPSDFGQSRCKMYPENYANIQLRDDRLNNKRMESNSLKSESTIKVQKKSFYKKLLFLAPDQNHDKQYPPPPSKHNFSSINQWFWKIQKYSYEVVIAELCRAEFYYFEKINNLWDFKCESRIFIKNCPF